MKSVYRLLCKAEDALLISLFLIMLLMQLSQVIMRNFGMGGIVWAESFIRVLVLWIALLGAITASRGNHHIAIDVLVNKCPQYLKTAIQRMTHFLTAICCFLLFWFSYQFVKEEYQYGDIAFAHIPHWVCEAIIPAAFLLIGIRYAIATIYLFEVERK